MPDSQNAVTSRLIKKELDNKQTILIEGTDYLNPTHIREEATSIADTEVNVALDVHNKNIDHTSHPDKQDKLIDDTIIRPSGVESNFRTVAGQSLLGKGGDISVVIDVDEELDNESPNPVMNKALFNEFEKKQDLLIDDITSPVQNLKTVNNNSLLGQGNLEIGGSGVIDTELDDTSKNPVQNRVITEGIRKKQDFLIDDTTKPGPNDYDPVHPPVSNIKTINKQSILSDGVDTDLTIEGTVVDEEFIPDSVNPVQSRIIQFALKDKQDLLLDDITRTEEEKSNIKTINKQSVLGEGDLVIEGGIVDSELSTESTNPVQNRVLTTEINTKQTVLLDDTTEHPEKESNIKTINKQTILGGGDLTIEGTSVDDHLDKESVNPVMNKIVTTEFEGKQTVLLDDTTEHPSIVSNIKTINSETLLGAGNIEIKGGGIVIDDHLDNVSKNPVQNLVIADKFDTTQPLLFDDSTEHPEKESNIKTINKQSLLGAGDIQVGGGISVDTELDETSVNPVQNRVLTPAINEKQIKLESGKNISTINGKSLLTGEDIRVGDGISVDTELDETSPNPVQNKIITNKINTKQDLLKSGENIKTLNNNSLLGEGDIKVSGTVITIDNELKTDSTNPVQNKIITNKINTKQDFLKSGENIKTINKQSILGSGDITVSPAGVLDTKLDENSHNAVENQAITRVMNTKLGKDREGKDYYNCGHINKKINSAAAKAGTVGGAAGAAAGAAAVYYHNTLTSKCSCC